MRACGQVLSPIAVDEAMCLFKFYSNIDQFRIKQRKVNLFEFYIKMLANGRIDEMTIEQKLLSYLWRTLNFDPDEVAFLNFDPDEVAFEVKFVEDFPLDTNGKLRKVISELGHTPNYV